jgi:PAS domain-containing protein
MTDKHKTKEQLTQELAELHQRFAELKASEAQCAQTNEAQEAWERKSMALIENSPDIIYILDPDGNFTYLGGNFESLLGFTGEELTGRHFTSIIYPEDVKKAEWVPKGLRCV